MSRFVGHFFVLSAISFRVTAENPGWHSTSEKVLPQVTNGTWNANFIFFKDGYTCKKKSRVQKKLTRVVKKLN